MSAVPESRPMPKRLPSGWQSLGEGEWARELAPVNSPVFRLLVRRDLAASRYRCTCEPFVRDEEMRACFLDGALYEAEERLAGIVRPLLLSLTQGRM